MGDILGGDILGGVISGFGPFVGQVVVGQSSAAEVDIFNVAIPGGTISGGGQVVAQVQGIIVNGSGAAQTAQLRLRYGAAVITPPNKSLGTGTNMLEKPQASLSYQGGPSLNNGFVAWWNYGTLYAQAAFNVDSTIAQIFRLTIQFGVANAALYYLRTSVYIDFIPPTAGVTP